MLRDCGISLVFTLIFFINNTYLFYSLGAAILLSPYFCSVEQYGTVFVSSSGGHQVKMLAAG